jgi:glycerol-1-phosphate dehydrogenase [NAD(P)+]
MLAAYQWLLRQDVESMSPADRAMRLPPASALRAEIEAAFPEPFMALNAEAETMAKSADPAAIERRLRLLRDNWGSLAARLRRRLPDPGTVRQWLAAVGAPTDGAAIGISAQKHAADYRRARLIRRRYTALDLMHELGWLDDAVRSLFSGNGFWRPNAGA